MPQFAQNFAAPISLPQPVQNFFAGAAASVAPHSAQNFPEGTWALHFGQLTFPPAGVGAAECAPCWRCGGVNCGPCGPPWPYMAFAIPMPTAICAPSPAAPEPSPPFAMPSPAPIIAEPAA